MNTTPSTPTTPVRHAASVIRTRTDIDETTALEIAETALQAALSPFVIAPVLWDMDQQRNGTTRAWNNATTRERTPYLEAATEYRTAVFPNGTTP